MKNGYELLIPDITGFWGGKWRREYEGDFGGLGSRNHLCAREGGNTAARFQERGSRNDWEEIDAVRDCCWHRETTSWGSYCQPRPRPPLTSPSHISSCKVSPSQKERKETERVKMRKSGYGMDPGPGGGARGRLLGGLE